MPMWLESHHVKVKCGECGVTEWIARPVRDAKATLFNLGWCLKNPDESLHLESVLFCPSCMKSAFEDAGWT